MNLNRTRANKSLAEMQVMRERAVHRYAVEASGSTATVYLYGPIGSSDGYEGVTPTRFRDDLKRLGDIRTIHVHINSEGGSAFDGALMYNLLRQHRARKIVHIDGLAASIASLVAMSGDRVVMGSASFLMIHEAWADRMTGDARKLQQTVRLLESVNKTMTEAYARRSGQSIEQIQTWMAEETWFSASDAVKNGFADEVASDYQVAASLLHPDRYKHPPPLLIRHNRNRKVATQYLREMNQMREWYCTR